MKEVGSKDLEETFQEKVAEWVKENDIKVDLPKGLRNKTGESYVVTDSKVYTFDKYKESNVPRREVSYVYFSPYLYNLDVGEGKSILLIDNEEVNYEIIREGSQKGIYESVGTGNLGELMSFLREVLEK